MRLGVAALVVAALSLPATARAQPCAHACTSCGQACTSCGQACTSCGQACTSCGQACVRPPSSCARACAPCGQAGGAPCGVGCGARTLTADPVEPLGPSRAELETLLAGGAGLAIGSYVFGVLLARNQPSAIAAVDGIPVVGAVASAARNVAWGHDTSLLLVSAAVQAMGLIIVGAAATELSDRRWSIDFGGGPNGCAAAVTWHFH